MPHLKELLKRYKGQGLALIGIHSDENAAKMKATVKQLGITWPIAQDGKAKTLEAFYSYGYPTYCLIDRKGRLRVCDADPADLDRAIAVLVREKP